MKIFVRITVRAAATAINIYPVVQIRKPYRQFLILPVCSIKVTLHIY